MVKRVFLIILDSFGIGELPDAKNYNDTGSNTLRSIYGSKKFNISNLRQMGLLNIDGTDYAKGVDSPCASFGRAAEKSKGKDTTTGHWEICGIVSEKPMPTYPNGFPQDIIDKFEKATGRKVLCNKPYSGTQVIKDYGREHVETGALIVYTSADSVFQIAAHEDVVPLETLYDYCKTARELLTGENSVGRVIARPFIGTYPDFERTPNRHDFSLLPPADTVLDYLKNNGYDTISIGKINDIFAGKGITEKIPTKGNKSGMDALDEVIARDFRGLCFANLVDFDMLYGHRNDVDGYADAISAFDSWLSSFIPKLQDDDVLIITADHGCDPATQSTDHSREYIPIIAYGNNLKKVNIGTRWSFSDIGKSVADMFGLKNDLPGLSFWHEIGGDL